MKKNIYKLLSLVITFVILLAFIPAVPTEAAPKYDKKITVVMYTKGQEASFTVKNLKSGNKIKKSGVKSSKKAVATITKIDRNVSYNYTQDFFEGTKKTEENYSYTINFKLKKAGKTNISFKIGKKTYKVKVVVKAYENPFKTLKISGVNGGKSIGSKFKKKYYTYLSGVSSKSANLKLNMKDGWKVNGVTLQATYPTCTEDITQENYVFDSDGSEKEVSIATVDLGTLKDYGAYTLYIYVENKNGAEETIVCYMNR